MGTGFTLVAVGIHHLDLLSGGRLLSAGGNCLMVMNWRMTWITPFILSTGMVRNQWTSSWWSALERRVICCRRWARIVYVA